MEFIYHDAAWHMHSSWVITAVLLNMAQSCLNRHVPSAELFQCGHRAKSPFALPWPVSITLGSFKLFYYRSIGRWINYRGYLASNDTQR